MFDQVAKQILTTTNFLNLGTLKRWQTQATLSLVVTDGRTLEPSLLVATFSTENHKLITLVFYIHFLCATKAMYAIFQLAFLENLYLVNNIFL